jgi:3'-phosphoadenosine 5'-phosphosulfate sulfotransferase (PAPS reductase)/FAD synthetase
MSTLNISQNPVIFSFGAGVQSTAILLLIKYEPERVISAMGKLPDWIIFADTGAENQEALDNLKRCKTLLPILRVKNWARNAETRPTDVPVFFW